MKTYGLTATPLPNPLSEGANIADRSSRYGDKFVLPVVMPGDLQAIEGSHFRLVNGTTPSTGIACPVSTGVTETAPILVMTYTGSKQLVIDWIRLLVTVIPASSTDVRFQIALDNVATRYTSGGTVLSKVNSNIGSALTLAGTYVFGTIVATAASGGRVMSDFLQFKTVIPVVNSTFTIQFGANAGSSNNVNSLAAAAAENSVLHTGPCVLGPNTTLLLYGLYTANAVTGPSYAPIIACYER